MSSQAGCRLLFPFDVSDYLLFVFVDWLQHVTRLFQREVTARSRLATGRRLVTAGYYTL